MNVMSSSNKASELPTVYPARKTKGAAASSELFKAGCPTRPTTKQAAPARKGQAKAFDLLNTAAANAPPPGTVLLGSMTRAAAAAKAKDQPASTFSRLDLSSVTAGQLLWYRYAAGESTFWIPAKVSNINGQVGVGDTSVTLQLPRSKMETMSQSKIDKEDRPILELISSNHDQRVEILTKRKDGYGALAELARMGLDKLNGEWKISRVSGSSSSSALSNLLSGGGLKYNLTSSISSVTKSSTKTKPASRASTESELSDADSSDDDFQGAANANPRNPRKRAGSLSISASATSSSAPSKKARTDPPKQSATGIATVTFTRRAAPRPANTNPDSTSDSHPATTAANFLQESLLDSLASGNFPPPVLSGSESDSEMDIPGVRPSVPRPSHLELSVPVGISVLAHRSDPELGSRFAPARVLGYTPNDQLHVRFYDGLENVHLPRTEMVIMGDAEFGSANVEAIPEVPPPPRGYRNPVLEARIKAVMPALDEIVSGKRTSVRVALFAKSISVRASDRRAAETELAGRLGGEPYSAPEMKLIRRALEARYVLGVAGLAQELEEVLMASQGDEVEVPSSSQGRRGAAAKGKGKAKAGSATPPPVQVSPDRQRRSRKGVTTYAESSSDSDSDSDLEFIKEKDGDGNIVATNSGGPSSNHSQLTPPHILSAAELADAPSLETTFPAPPASLPCKEQRFTDLVLFPECLARLIVLTHLTDAQTGVIADTSIRTAGGVGDDMDVDELTDPITLASSSSSSSLLSSQPQAAASSAGVNSILPDWHLRAVRQFKMNSDQYNDPRTWRDVPEVTTRYGLSAEQEVKVLPMAEELLRDCHWMQALLLLKRSNSGKGQGRSRR